jgi:hypothetical protein
MRARRNARDAAFRRLLSAEFLNADDFLLPYCGNVRATPRYPTGFYFARILSTFVSPVDEEGRRRRRGRKRTIAPSPGVLQPVYDWVKRGLSGGRRFTSADSD